MKPYEAKFSHYYDDCLPEPRACLQCTCTDIRHRQGVNTCFKCGLQFMTNKAVTKEVVLYMPQLTRPIHGGLGLFFPVGELSDGGSCEFATVKCLQYCYVKNRKSGDMQEDMIYQHFKDNEAYYLALRLMIESDNVKLIHFFVSGDCPQFLTSKFASILKSIDGWGIAICGFTRNKELWERSQNLKAGRLALTIEGIESIKEYGDGLFALPDYNSGIVHLYRQVHGHSYNSGGCGGYSQVPYQLTTTNYINYKDKGCSACAILQKGCFASPE